MLRRSGRFLLKTHRVNLKPTHPAIPRLRELAAATTAAWNQMLYRQRQAFFDPEQSVPSALTVRKELVAERHPTYLDVPYKVLRETSRLLQQSWNSYWALRKNGHAEARIPRYKKHGTPMVMQFDRGDQISKRALNRGWIRVGGISHDLIPFSRSTRVRQVRIRPNHGSFTVEVVYAAKERPVRASGPQKWAGADLGVGNFITVAVDDPGVIPLIVKGSELKATNQWVHKETSRRRSCLTQGATSSRHIRTLWNNRNSRIKDLMHAASRAVVNYLVQHAVTDLVVGWNTGWKSDAGLSKQFNQQFRSLPHRQFVEQLTYKCAEVGIRVHVTEESYTSKTSLLDFEEPVKHDKYAGRRVKRGLFLSRTGRVINADVNGAAQILKKCKPNAFHWLADGVAGRVADTPLVVRPGGGPVRLQ